MLLPTFTLTTWLILALCAMLVGLAKTALPGLACLPVAILAAALPAKESTAVILLMLMTGDLLAIWTYRHDADWKTLKNLLPQVVVGVVLGAGFLYLVNNQIMKISIGVIILLLTLTTILVIRRAEKTDRDLSESMLTNPWLKGFYGGLSGFTTMAANAGGPVVSLYFLAARFEVIRFMGTQAWFFFLVNCIKLPLSAQIGLIHQETLLTALIMAPIVIGFALLGRWWIGRINNQIFDPIVLALTLLGGTFLLI